MAYVVSFRLAGGHLRFSKILKDKRKGKLGLSFRDYLFGTVSLSYLY